MQKRIVVGMSGGVDSSVAALLLKNAGYEVIGLFMKNWEETDANGVCSAARDYEDVAAVCDKIGIPYYSVNFVKEYQEKVFSEFLAACQSGLTPNPDILCNREIKFNVFFQQALKIGADYLATGHYCRTNEHHDLLKGSDPDKDQSYFLYAIKETALDKTLFPIGHLLKKEVRSCAKKAELITADKKDSTGICFIGERNYKQFLGGYLGFQEGPLLTLDGKIVGHHDGAAYLTIGQRKGIGLGGEGEAWYVVKKDPSQNIVYVERGANHPALYSNELTLHQISWIHQIPELPLRCSAKIRYRQKDTPCTLTAINADSCRVVFDVPQRAITPGQSIVFYDGDITLGGGVIYQSGSTFFEMKKPLPFAAALIG